VSAAADLPEQIAPHPTSIARDRLLRRIHDRFDTRVERMQFGPLALRFVRVADPDVVLDEVAEAEDREQKRSGRRLDGDYLHLPYWAELWDSAPGLARWLAHTVSTNGWGALVAAPALPAPHPLPPPNVLDLGCGMGLTGAVAAALGARVLFADLEPAALLFARLNSLPYSGNGRPARVRARQLNWQTDRLGERFDLILGADILYERKQWAHLEPFWRAHLAPGGVVLLGEPGRPTGDDFIEWIRARGWSLKEFEQPVETRPKPIRLFRLSRAAPAANPG
jgi:predicted nicotinamide N-methyase